ncbi:hypothetical protein [Halorubrum yunnanense]|jgi:hypothetical protein|uniref:Uncharacterized protein n=1 Tax=Halorubrum yunnanense TaxID=1526162 RepID=A0ABD5YEJ1_9EURY|nr:hypothetical protein [Halorubrum yunnanense]
MFELDVPANATDPTANLGPEITDYGSYDNLVAAPNASVSAAEIGNGFSFEEGTILDGESYYAVTLRYDAADRAITVNTQAEPIGEQNYDELDTYEEVAVGDWGAISPATRRSRCCTGKPTSRTRCTARPVTRRRPMLQG